MFDRIVVVIDFSKRSVRSLRWTVTAFPQAEIILFHPLKEVRSSSEVRQSLTGKVDPAEAEQDAKANLELLTQEICPTAEVVVRSGDFVEELAGATATSEAQLVVLAAHEKRIWPWERYDAVAERVCDCVDLPILIFRPTEVTGEFTVLAPLDLREGSEPVGRVAGWITAHVGGRLVVLHVLPKTFQGFLRAASSPYQTEETLRKAESSARREALGRIPAEYRDEIDIQVRVARGQPARQILATLQSEQADLIVMGKTHLRKRTERALMGHVTGMALRNAPCSVLTVPI